MSDVERQLSECDQRQTSDLTRSYWFIHADLNWPKLWFNQYPVYRVSGVAKECRDILGADYDN